MSEGAARAVPGRWGSDGERGALNLLDPMTVLHATQVCKTPLLIWAPTKIPS